MMFRRPREIDDKRQSQRLLFVMIVGESPTTGVAKVPLAKCLDVVLSYHRDRLFDVLARAPREPLLDTFSLIARLTQVDLHIVGPMFSGSHQSLALVLSRWFQEHENERWVHYRPSVRSGDADAIIKNTFERDSSGAGRWPASRVKVTFDSTLQHRKLVMLAILEFLRELNGGKSLGKMALLTESDTEFGNPKEWAKGWNELVKETAGTHTDGHRDEVSFPYLAGGGGLQRARSQG